MLSIEQQSVFVDIIDSIISGYRPRTLAKTEVVADSLSAKKIKIYQS